MANLIELYCTKHVNFNELKVGDKLVIKGYCKHDRPASTNEFKPGDLVEIIEVIHDKACKKSYCPTCPCDYVFFSIRKVVANKEDPHSYAGSCYFEFSKLIR
jgi:hypothetical protein